MGRCEATTQNGDQCQHPATDGEYCWIHAGEEPGTRAGMRKYDIETVAQALRKADSYQEAADMLGCHPTTVSDYAKTEPECIDAWKPTIQELTGIGRNGLRHLAVSAQDESVRLRACKLLVENYDDEQVPSKTDVTSGGDKVDAAPVVMLPDNGKCKDDGSDDS